MFVSCVCCTERTKGKRQDNQDKEVRIKVKRKNNNKIPPENSCKCCELSGSLCD
jgi:hypothetical protein